jgi:hypothetical protein
MRCDPRDSFNERDERRGEGPDEQAVEVVPALVDPMT